MQIFLDLMQAAFQLPLLGFVLSFPEVFLAVMAMLIALGDLFDRTEGRRVTFTFSLLTLLVYALMTALLAIFVGKGQGFGAMYVSDAMGNWLKTFSALALMLVFIYGRVYVKERAMPQNGGEFFSLGLLGLLGIAIMISGGHFLTIYLGLELLTLSSYALVALRRDDLAATEAAMKYFVLGALASGFLLYGLSMLYGATGSLEINTVLQAIQAGVAQKQILVMALVFVVAGLAFKLGAAPFHMWIPDVYHGAPTAITLYIGAAPKLAAFAIIMRLLVEGMLPLSNDWQQMLAVLAVMSLLVGNLAAIAQKSLKRMLAYSTIAQMGFVLLGIIPGVINGNTAPALNAYSSAMFYVVVYVFTTLASFGVILLLARKDFESDRIEDLAGLNQRSSWLAGVMAACMFSLAGIPPLVGFMAKLGVLQALVASQLPMLIALAVFAVIMSLIGAFYYLRVVKIMYFDAPSEEIQSLASQATPSCPNYAARAALGLNGLSLLLLGLMPSILLDICAQAMIRTFS